VQKESEGEEEYYNRDFTFKDPIAQFSKKPFNGYCLVRCYANACQVVVEKTRVSDPTDVAIFCMQSMKSAALQGSRR